VETSILAAIPSPSQGVWHVGPVPIRAYALCIVLGIVVACLITDRRMRSRGAPSGAVLDIAVLAVPFGILGARVYHVITSPAAYFGADGNPIDALKIWQGGLGIWGGVAGGALGAWLACRRLGIPLTFFGDAVAPALPLAQAIGRLGNWFNNELYGRETSLPWGLTIHEWDAGAGRAVTDVGTGEPIVRGIFHPAFLYESIWNVAVAVLVWQLDKRYRFGRGRAFALYAMAYTLGRFWIEALRSDEANHILGMRVNSWVSIIVFLGALAYFLRVRGPQQHLAVGEDGTVRVLPAGAEAAATRTDAADSATDGQDASLRAGDQASGPGRAGASDVDPDAVDQGGSGRGGAGTEPGDPNAFGGGPGADDGAQARPASAG